MPKLAGKRVLVTGGAGFIGSHLVDRIVRDGPESVAVVDNYSLGKPENLCRARQVHPELREYRADAGSMRAMRRIVRKERPDVVFSLAVVPLPASLQRPYWSSQVNVAIANVACELLREGRYGTLVHFSSSEVYGTAQVVPMDEDHPIRPKTPYAAAKAAGDHLVASYGHTFGLDVATVRPFNNIGPRQNEKAYAGVVPIVIRAALGGAPVTIFGDGKQTRDFVFVEDTAEAAVRVFEEARTRGRVVNIATGREVSIRRLVQIIFRLMNAPLRVVHGPPRPADVQRHCGASGLARELLGFDHFATIEESLIPTIDWYRQRGAVRV